MKPLQLWGGVECTVNRVHDRYHDQLRRNGHYGRIEDLDRFASLGFKALRQPLIWEQVVERGWEQTDGCFARLRELGIRPIATLLHHGSGPRDTSLVDPDFPRKLAAFARRAAERYPWVTDWTPVNEPLTTARFSGLYGFWYPHGKDDQTFLRCLYGECLGSALAMREIRAVQPQARLVQTEDMGETFATPKLAYQARLENQRRWLSLDLLAGAVLPEHPLWGMLTSHGVREEELLALAAAAVPPDVIALNYYLTSDRVLDERLEHYPRWSHGGNGRDTYADVEAVRARKQGIVGHREVLLRAWNRYRRPVALGEVHLGCTRDEQLRWLVDAYRACLSAREVGAEVEAMTIWSLLGAFDWNRLVVEEKGFYEPGVYDVRAPKEPRETALAWAARDLAKGRVPEHPVLSADGFWRRRDRLLWGPGIVPSRPHVIRKGPPLAVIGATGTLGQAFARACAARALHVRLLSRRELDIAVSESVEAALSDLQPWAVVNAAGYVRVDDAENDVERCERENTVGSVTLAEACASRGVPLVTFSSDLVFDGKKGAPYVESDRPSPLSVYGRSKALAEARVLAAHPDALVVRTSAFFGPWDESNFVAAAIAQTDGMRRFRAASDAVVTPTYVPDLVDACLDLLLDRASGVWHVAGPSAMTWEELARRAVEAAGNDPRLVEGVRTSELGLRAARPLHSALASERGVRLPLFEDALSRYLGARERYSDQRLAANGSRTVCGGGDACPGDGRCGVHR